MNKASVNALKLVLTQNSIINKSSESVDTTDKILSLENIHSSISFLNKIISKLYLKQPGIVIKTSYLRYQ